MLYDDEVFENFKEKLKVMGYKHVFKISGAISEGVEPLLKTVAEVLSQIPVQELELIIQICLYQKRRDSLMI